MISSLEVKLNTQIDKNTEEFVMMQGLINNKD